MDQLAFHHCHHCDQNSWHGNKEGRLCFGSQFEEVQFVVSWPHVLGQNIVAMGTCGGGSLSPQDGQEEEKERAIDKRSLPLTKDGLPGTTSCG